MENRRLKQIMTSCTKKRGVTLQSDQQQIYQKKIPGLGRGFFIRKRLILVFYNIGSVNRFIVFYHIDKVHAHIQFRNIDLLN